MKTSFNTLIVVALVSLLVGFAFPQLTSVKVAAQNAPEQIITSPPTEQYLVLDTSRFPVASPQRAGPTLQAMLNDLGAQGWRVRATMSTFIIMAR